MKSTINCTLTVNVKVTVVNDMLLKCHCALVVRSNYIYVIIIITIDTSIKLAGVYMSVRQWIQSLLYSSSSSLETHESWLTLTLASSPETPTQSPSKTFWLCSAAVKFCVVNCHYKTCRPPQDCSTVLWDRQATAVLGCEMDKPLQYWVVRRTSHCSIGLWDGHATAVLGCDTCSPHKPLQDNLCLWLINYCRT